MPAKRAAKSDADTSGALSGLPTYAKMLAWVGFPGAAAAYLIYILASSQAQRIQRIEDTLAIHEKTSAAIVAQLKTQSDQTWIEIAVISRICLNTAKTDEDRVACVTTGGRPPQ